MISVAEAQALLAGIPWELGVEEVALEVIAGRVLAQDLIADRDGPPYDRVAMDGVAVSRDSLTMRRLRVTGLQAAGGAPLAWDGSGTALEVATGAVLPTGCDAVIPYEQVTMDGREAILPESLIIRARQNVHGRGEDYARGEVLIPAGTLLRSPHAHLLATCGLARVPVKRRCRWALAATGDELVEIESAPLPHQIRRSNGPAIQAEARAWGLAPASSCLLPDDEGALESAIGQLIGEHDALVLTGGVSRGALDHVPEVLKRLGVREVFHKVAQKPGKPLWYGISAQGTRVFGLPGNPVASLVTFRRYVLPDLLSAEGRGLDPTFVHLEDGVAPSGSLTRFLPASPAGASYRVDPRGGSGDLHPLSLSEGFVQVDPGWDGQAPVPFFPWGLSGAAS